MNYLQVFFVITQTNILRFLVIFLLLISGLVATVKNILYWFQFFEMCWYWLYVLGNDQF